MMHPQAVMMAQTAVSSAMVLAMQMMLGPKADGMSVDALTAAMAKFVQKHGTGPLITALPYGQRDALASNATLLERHAVMMADLADTIQGLRLVKDRSLDGDTVLAQQAQALAGSFHLAASAGAELKRLKQQRAAHRARIAKYLRARGN
jgi:hypothetical protein